MRRFFNILLGALAMLAVALLSAFLAMRIAIHGREVEVPNLADLTVQEAVDRSLRAGLTINLENRFYSTVTPAGRVLSQSPAPGAKVRRDWTVRITQSLGAQKVSVPNVIGQTERAATVNIRRLALDLGTVAYLPSPGPPNIVLTQTPTPDAAGIDGPRISLLVSEPLGTERRRIIASSEPDQPASDEASGTTADTATGAPTSAQPGEAVAAAQPTAQAAAIPTAAPLATPAATPATAEAAPPPAFVMPSLIGLTLSAASARISVMGLHIASIEAVPTPIKPIPSIPSPTAPNPGSSTAPAPIRPLAPVAPITLANTVVAQTPAAGHRVTRDDTIHITLSR
jgi:eukaryotic-like serine/threonine-protein kinase